MNLKISSFIRNFSYSIFSNIISLAISTLVIALVPKVVDVTGYGYFQLYMFYASYIGFFHLGWCDGIYLRYGGEYYENLDKNRMSSQFWLLFFFELIITIVLFSIIYIISPEHDKFLILFLTAFSILIIIPKTMLSYILQMTNRIKEYSIITITEKIVYCIFVIFFLLSRNNNYYMYIYADLIGKLFSLLIALFYCSDIVLSKMIKLSDGLKEAFVNINIGSKLMIANIAGMLILGIIRIAIEDNWSIEVFGKVSLSISVSNLMMVFINAMGIVLFPMLKRMNDNIMNALYDKIRDVLMIMLFIMLVFYYPLKEILSIWLPSYKESFRYMALLFPLCIYECKMSLLVSTYLKACRKEKAMLYVNIITVALSIICSLLFVYKLKSIELAVFSIFALFAFRCILSEVFLLKYLNKRITMDILLEVILSLIFIISFYYIKDIMGLLNYISYLIIYLIIKRESIHNIYKQTKRMKNKLELVRNEEEK